MGIRKKISLGFLILALLLFFSGLVSLYELDKLSKQTQEILETSTSNTELSKRMLDAAEIQNGSLLEMIVLDRDDYDEAFTEARKDFEQALNDAAESEVDRDYINNIYSAKSNYYELVGAYFDEDYRTDAEWFLSIYKTTYNQLTSSIKAYMIGSQHAVALRSSHIEENAYRAITPGIITLSVSILIVLIFAFFIDIFYLRPIVRINESVRQYNRHDKPFRDDTGGTDEVAELSEGIRTALSSRRRLIKR